MDLSIFLAVVASIFAVAAGIINVVLWRAYKQAKNEANRYIKKNLELRMNAHTTNRGA